MVLSLGDEYLELALQLWSEDEKARVARFGTNFHFRHQTTRRRVITLPLHLPQSHHIMVFKPFKPPSLLRKPIEVSSRISSDGNGERAPKRQRVSDEVEPSPSTPDIPVVATKATICKSFIPHRRPLHVIKNDLLPKQERSESGVDSQEVFYTVLWRKFTQKKHKTWDGDGILCIKDGYAHLKDIGGRDMGKILWTTPLLSGSTLSIGGKDIEVDSLLSKEEFLSGRLFLGTKSLAEPVPISSEELVSVESKPVEKETDGNIDLISKPVISLAHKITYAGFKKPSISRSILPGVVKPTAQPVPRHDPQSEGALVMKRLAVYPKGKQIVDVVVDPFIGRHLRDHQREGVQFLYECVMGMRCSEGDGAILADEMGLGKTLQTIALLWTLLKQNPIYEAPPVVKKAIIVCPASVINNWRKEFRKWLGYDRVGVFIAHEKKTRLTDFTKGKIYSVMIIGYEKLRTVQDDLKDIDIDIVIADEGHRLKTAQNQSALAIKSLNTNRKIVLSGTPIQNDLKELFMVADLVNPNVFGKYNTFKREFETPIVKSRQPDATKKDIEKGEARNEELARLTSQFMLRRTVDIIAKYLPPKTETTLFCRPTAAQASLYHAVLGSSLFSAILGSTEASLQLITMLKKLCNSPSLFLKSVCDESNPSDTIQSLIGSIPQDALKLGPSASAKLRVLDSLLHRLREDTDDKVVIVSNYTSTLDMIAALLSSLNYSFLRLDGQTPVSKRQGLIDQFNKSKQSTYFAFLLSSKAGGVGVNLIGASRLVLFDVDWNPATDLQSMARIHRDGQKKPCYIYRLLVQGALDEKIYQRQLTKTGLADAVMDAKKTAQGFTRDELRDLFSLEEGDPCPTHTLLGCECQGNGNVRALSAAGDDSFVGKTIDGRTEDEEDEDLPSIATLMSASKVDMEAQEKAIRRASRKSKKDGEEKMLALMQFLHIDATKVRDGFEEVDSLLEDTVLLSMLKEKESRVSFVFAKTTG